MMFAFFFSSSAIIYWLSADLVVQGQNQIFANPTIVLYFRLLVGSIPFIIGLLIGVPLLSSEYESGTYRYLFTQGVGRWRLVSTVLGVYFVSIVLFSAMLIISINHFLAVQQSAEPITIWSFGVFVFYPIIIVPLILTAFVAGVFIGVLMKRVILGIAAAMLFGVIFALGLKAFFDELLSTAVQGLFNSLESTLAQHYDFYGRNDPRYLFQFQVSFASLLIFLAVLLTLSSLRAICSDEIVRRKLGPLRI